MLASKFLGNKNKWDQSKIEKSGMKIHLRRIPEATRRVGTSSNKVNAAQTILLSQNIHFLPHQIWLQFLKIFGL